MKPLTDWKCLLAVGHTRKQVQAVSHELYIYLYNVRVLIYSQSHLIVRLQLTFTALFLLAFINYNKWAVEKFSFGNILCEMASLVVGLLFIKFYNIQCSGGWDKE